MRKLVALILTAILFVGAACETIADENSTKTTSGSQVLTAVVPQTTWELVIPADATIPYKQSSVSIGTVRITNVENLNEQAAIVASVRYMGELASQSEKITIPYSLSANIILEDGNSYSYEIQKKAEVSVARYSLAENDYRWYSELTVSIADADWGVPPGSYSETIQYSSYLR